MAPPPPHSPDFAERIIFWQRQQGRHDLPWQVSGDPYRVWLSEIMLQQTQVATVIPYYLRFLERFPSLPLLAAAPLDEVLALWAGLGYYARARNLHRCAQQVMAEHGGIFPDQPLLLAELAGIGRSTAAAIAVFSSERRAAILDGNVKRVFCRHFGFEGFPNAAPVERELWALAENLLPHSDLSAYTQGLMDLGATCCRPRQAECGRCPLASTCIAAQTGRQSELPVARPRKALPTRVADVLLVSDGDSVLLEKRPPAGIWGGLLAPPQGEIGALQSALGLSGQPTLPLPEQSHSFTHFRLQLRPYLCTVEVPPAHDAAAWTWLALTTIDAAALPAPISRLLKTLLKPAPNATHSNPSA